MQKNFENEIAFLLSKFDELEGSIEMLKSKNKSLQNKVNGLEYDNQQLLNQIQNLKKYNSRVLKDFQDLKENLDSDQILMAQNFTFSNKILSIVKDIENKELDSTQLVDIVDLMIQEIDFCIDQLKR
jgi:chromosome segregation ATPase